MNEEWRPVVGYEGLYSISSLGRVRSEARLIARMTGSFRRLELIMSPASAKAFGYLSLRLAKDGVIVTRYVHHLVLDAFAGPRTDGQEACHRDGNRKNNAASNLRWDTRKANHADKRAHGTSLSGERHPGAKLRMTDVERMREIRRSTGQSYRLIAISFGVTPMTAHRAITGALWK